jgi:hypothetical protein
MWASFFLWLTSSPLLACIETESGCTLFHLFCLGGRLPALCRRQDLTIACIAKQRDGSLAPVCLETMASLHKMRSLLEWIQAHLMYSCRLQERATHICLDCGYIYTLQKSFDDQVIGSTFVPPLSSSPNVMWPQKLRHALVEANEL